MPLVDTFAKICDSLEPSDEQIGKEVRKSISTNKHDNNLKKFANLQTFLD